jgi:EAL domain-containing protein (putative c-di-GMP-specific phosphodiesterase class I)/PleD family two-component response regulator
MTSTATQPGEPIPIVVLSRTQEQVEAINSILRRAGHAAHCTWRVSEGELPETLSRVNPELLIVFAEDNLLPLESIHNLRKLRQPAQPILLVWDRLNEVHLTNTLIAGAQDAICLKAPEHLSLVCARELHSFRLERGLITTLSATQTYQNALADFMAGSADAIALAQDGILVNANTAWLHLFGATDANALNAQLLMDWFEPESHIALKGAMTATINDQWPDYELQVTAKKLDGTPMRLELVLGHAKFEGETAIRLMVRTRRHDEAAMQSQLNKALRTDISTGLLHRSHFLEAVAARLEQPIAGGMRFIVFIAPDRMQELAPQLGPLLVEALTGHYAQLALEHAGGAVAGRFTTTGLMFLLELGNLGDAEAWARELVRKIQGRVFQLGSRSISITASAGVSAIPPGSKEFEATITDAITASHRAAADGGNRVQTLHASAADSRLMAHDANWVRQLEAALAADRFRLVQQPIASLQGTHQGMYDLLVRLVDENGVEVLPSEFIPAAERNQLMTRIDRWVINAAIDFCLSKNPTIVFVRLCRDTVVDHDFVDWLQATLRHTAISPEQLCFQISATLADQHIVELSTLRQKLTSAGCRFAVENFGVGTSPEQILTHLNPDVVKLAGSLMQGITDNTATQKRVKQLFQMAAQTSAITIAERVDSANAMAVLWQLGIEFIQGNFVHEPEAITLE